MTGTAPAPRRVSELRTRHRVIHGHRIAFRMAGRGPAVLLIHGIGDTSDTWADILPGLARDHRIIAPDLTGHGASDKPRADYSVAGFANSMRDLLTVLGIERVTLVGHSLGGGVAMQFAYQFPERCERLVLVGTGGVGRQVTPLLRAATVPGAELALAALQLPGMRLPLGLLVRLARLLGGGLALDAPELLRVVEALPDGPSRQAFVRTLRSVVDWRGQVGTLMDRCYLARGMPTMLVWGRHDEVVPAIHAGLAHMAMPGSRLEIFDGAGHFPFRHDPQRFLALLKDFIAHTEPARYSAEEWRTMLRARRPHPRSTTVTPPALPHAV
ncbi:alpha/beta fold hydrolase [Streptomyces sp. NPDC002076]